jgi:hypothetical protein
MIAPNLPGSVVPARWRENYARQIPALDTDLSPPVPAATGKQHNNRRIFFGFSLAEPFAATQNIAVELPN